MITWNGFQNYTARSKHRSDTDILTNNYQQTAYDIFLRGVLISLSLPGYKHRLVNIAKQ